LNIHYTTQFKKDYKRIKKQNKDPDQLKVVIAKLVAGKKLEPKYRDHWLSGDWKGHRDCHIEPDWILIFRIEDEDLCIVYSQRARHGSNITELITKVNRRFDP
jgi:mRNA interferase YafQ